MKAHVIVNVLDRTFTRYPALKKIWRLHKNIEIDFLPPVGLDFAPCALSVERVVYNHLSNEITVTLGSVDLETAHRFVNEGWFEEDQNVLV